MTPRTLVAFIGCFLVLVGVGCYFVYACRVRRAARLDSRRAEEAATRFYAELLARLDLARATVYDEAEEEIELDERIPFLAILPDKSLHAAMLDEELFYVASSNLSTTALAIGDSTQRSSNASEDVPAVPTRHPQSVFINPPSLETPSDVSGTGPTDAHVTSSSQCREDALRNDRPPTPFASPSPATPAQVNPQTMSQRLWRLGSAVLSPFQDPRDIPPTVIWSIATVAFADLPSFLAQSDLARDRSASLRGGGWLTSRSLQQFSGALGLARAESGGSSRSLWPSRSAVPDPPDTMVSMPMHPEEDHSDEHSDAIAADYPEGTWPDPLSTGLPIAAVYRAGGSVSLSRRGSASGRLNSISKSLSQMLSLNTAAERAERLDEAIPVSVDEPAQVRVALPAM